MKLKCEDCDCDYDEDELERDEESGDLLCPSCMEDRLWLERRMDEYRKGEDYNDIVEYMSKD